MPAETLSVPPRPPLGPPKRVLGVGLLFLTGIGAAGCNAGSAAPSPPPPFDGKRAWAHLEAIVAIGPRPAGSARLEATRVYLEKELVGAGLKPVREVFQAQTPIGDVEFTNLYADLPSVRSAADDSMVLLCAHYDTKRLPFHFVGANDAGSSTAVLLELARSLALRPPQEGITYRFLFLDGEESVRPEWSGSDNRYGSRYHADRLKREGQVERVAACVLVDMVGDRDLKLTWDLNSTAYLQEIFLEAARDLHLDHHFGAPAQRMLDDHLSFLEVGIDSVDLIDFEYGPDNAWWHEEEDTLDKCAPESLDAIGKIVLQGLALLEARLEAR